MILIILARMVRRRRKVTPWVSEWHVRCITGFSDPGLTRWIVSRKVGEMVENLYYPPPGYKDGPVLASFKTEREARGAAAKANDEAGRA